MISSEEESRSSALAEWVKISRGDRKQRELAVRAGISHQAWSKLERDGVVPRPATLQKVCEALGKPYSEARDILIAEDVTRSRRRNFNYDYRKFKADLVRRAQKPDRQPLQLFVIREDAEPSDSIAVDQHIELLREADKIEISILFRTSNPETRQSFPLLAREIDRKLAATRSADPELATESEVAERFFGFYRLPAFEELSSPRIPMPHPVILISDDDELSVYSYDLHLEVLHSQTEAGVRRAEAQLRSIMLWPGTAELAERFANWMRARNRSTLPPNVWQKIDWSNKPA